MPCHHAAYGGLSSLAFGNQIPTPAQDSADTDKNSALANAVAKVDVAKVQSLLAQGADPNSITNGKTPFACGPKKVSINISLKDQEAVLKVLLEAALTGIANRPDINDIREAISTAILNQHPLNTSHQGWDPSFLYLTQRLAGSDLNTLRSRMGDDVSIYAITRRWLRSRLLKARSCHDLGNTAADNTDIRLRRNGNGKWKGSTVESVSVFQPNALRT